MKKVSKTSASIKKKKVSKKTAGPTAKKKKVAVKSPKKTVAPKKSLKKVVKKTEKKKPAAKKKIAIKTVRKKIEKAAVAPSVEKIPAETASVSVPSGMFIGKVTHYFGHSNAAVVELEAGTLAVGELVHIKGHTTDLKQTVESMQIDNQNIQSAAAGQTIGLKVSEMVREHDKVYKIERS